MIVKTTVQRPYIFALALIFVPVAVDAQKKPASTSDATQTTAATAADAGQMLAVQVALDRAGFSPGEIDGRGGTKTRLALSTFQKASRLQPTGLVSEETLAALRAPAEPVVSYTITPEDVAGPFIDAMPQDMMESAKLPALGYTSALEALAEKFHSSPALLRTLNPGATWGAGESIQVPAVEPFEIPSKPDASAATANTSAGAKPGAEAKAGTDAQAAAEPAASAQTKPAAAQRADAAAKRAASAALEVVVSGATKSLLVRDSEGKILMHAPVTVGSNKDPLPVGDWKVTGVSWNPTFNYNPDLFWDADPTHAKAKIPAGPNNPVGVVWIDINKEHFGLHGTPEPSTIGRTESHGCIRLANWDATRLARMVGVGTKVTIQ
jgi:lipoprotein-anchoring transpeptidase ErfK/SrfK